MKKNLVIFFLGVTTVLLLGFSIIQKREADRQVELANLYKMQADEQRARAEESRLQIEQARHQAAFAMQEAETQRRDAEMQLALLQQEVKKFTRN